MPIIIADEYGVLDNIEEPQNRMRLLQLFRPLVHSGSNSTAYWGEEAGIFAKGPVDYSVET